VVFNPLRLLTQCCVASNSSLFVLFLLVLSVRRQFKTSHDHYSFSIFNLYDINRDGLITREEMLNIISAIYELMGRFCEPSVYENTTRDHVEMVFQVVHRIFPLTHI
jgi:Ca2+-binding EF-hand superfamily protein